MCVCVCLDPFPTGTGSDSCSLVCGLLSLLVTTVLTELVPCGRPKPALSNQGIHVRPWQQRRRVRCLLGVLCGTQHLTLLVLSFWSHHRMSLGFMNRERQNLCQVTVQGGQDKKQFASARSRVALPQCPCRLNKEL